MPCVCRIPGAVVRVLVGVAVMAGLVGCGGGGGGGSRNSPLNRSFLYAASGQRLALTIDAIGRVTIFAVDPAQLPAGAAAQGSVAPDTGQFTVTSSDGAVQFAGTVAPGGQSATGTVRRNSTLVMAFAAVLVTSSRTTPGSLAGTYSGSSAGISALVTVNDFGQATAWVVTAAQSAGTLAELLTSGALQTSDNSFAGTLTQGTSGYQLQVTRLAGSTVNISLAVTKQSQARWTFLVFLNGANDLQEFASLNVNQMEMVGSTDSINIVVQWKQANCARCGNPDWVGTRRYFVRKDSDPAHVTSSVVQEMGTGIDMGDWRELRNFVQWAQRNYPADRYALVVWDHGAGWRPTRAPTPRFRSVSLDDSTNSEIQTWQLPQALDVTPKMDLVVFDASLMQMLEVVYEMRNTTPLVVGSEESPPGEGYVYNTFLADLASNPAMSPADFGRQIVTRTLQDYGPNGNNTQSLIDTTRVADVAAKVDAFGSVLARHLLPDVPPSTTAMAYARQNAESYKPPYDEYKDLWHYAELMRQQALALDQAAGTATRTDIQNAASAVKASLDAAVLAEGHGALHPNSHGLAAYVPDPGGYLASYGNLALARTATSWTNWLQRTP